MTNVEDMLMDDTEDDDGAPIENSGKRNPSSLFKDHTTYLMQQLLRTTRGTRRRRRRVPRKRSWHKTEMILYMDYFRTRMDFMTSMENKVKTT